MAACKCGVSPLGACSTCTPPTGGAPFASSVMDPIYRHLFVLEQHELYGALAGQIRAIRDRLDGDEELADVLVAETQQVLDSAMTREQIASALVSVMARVAQGEDLLASGAGTVGLYLSGALPIQTVRGGIRFPMPDPGAAQPAGEAGDG